MCRCWFPCEPKQWCRYVIAYVGYYVWLKSPMRTTRVHLFGEFDLYSRSQDYRKNNTEGSMWGVWVFLLLVNDRISSLPYGATPGCSQTEASSPAVGARPLWNPRKWEGRRTGEAWSKRRLTRQRCELHGEENPDQGSFQAPGAERWLPSPWLTGGCDYALDTTTWTPTCSGRWSWRHYLQLRSWEPDSWTYSSEMPSSPRCTSDSVAESSPTTNPAVWRKAKSGEDSVIPFADWSDGVFLCEHQEEEACMNKINVLI